MKRRRIGGMLAGVSGLALVVGSAQAAEPGFVGAERCRDCHAAEYAAWQGSDHDLAMQPATPASVLGDFGAAPLVHGAGTARFARRGDDYFVRTEGADGKPAEFRVAYTFGVDPLQQYLVDFPDGRKQVLPFAWDSRDAAAGGQRWFHIYGDEAIPPGDPLHWTGIQQNWNHMCADCHSTGLLENYRAEGDRFETRWAEIDVGCEACHGPGSAHVEWAETNRAGGSGARGVAGSRGLVVLFEPRAAAQWRSDPSTGWPRRTPARRVQNEVETCAPCHSRRAKLAEDALPGRSLLDAYRPALLDEGLYHADGQILDEVYEYGSFVQSRMYAAGVSCSDCHDPHSGALRAEGNALCTQCHPAERFDRSDHHHHPVESDGARCVECHMPERTYMQIDARRDHSLRVPRPDLSAQIGAPDACTSCHVGRKPEWASAAIAKWRGAAAAPRTPHFGAALHAGRSGAPGAGRALAALIEDGSAPAIARASALLLLPRYIESQRASLFASAARDPDPLLRLAALMAAESLDPALRRELAAQRLDDPLRALRFEAARLLAAWPRELLGGELLQRRERGLQEFAAALQRDRDRPETWLQLGVLALQREHFAEAAASFDRALALAPWFAPAAVNRADLHRMQGDDAQGERVLRDALREAPEDAALHHALGLLLLRQQHFGAALAELERSVQLAPADPRYAYVLAVALHEQGGEDDRALELLRAAARRQPVSAEIVGFLRQLEAQR